MPIIVASVPHSGTRFLMHHLNRPVITGSQINPSQNMKGMVILFHVYRENRPLLEKLALDIPVIVPTRDPAMVRQSWSKRGWRMGGPSFLEELLDYQAEFIGAFEPYVLPVDDLSCREDYLDSINFGLELDIKTDWEPVT